ncbi:TonB-dependent siderophore receptor [Frateuria aurantia]
MFRLLMVVNSVNQGGDLLSRAVGDQPSAQATTRLGAMRHALLATALAACGAQTVWAGVVNGSAGDDTDAKAIRRHSPSGSKAPVQLEAVKVQVSRAAEAHYGALGARSRLDIPFSVESVGSDSIEARQVHALGQLFSDDSSVASKGNTYTQGSYALNIRGLPVDFTNNYKINGQPFQMYGVEMPFEDLEEVQLLKGAGGFLYGMGAPGGIINFVTKKPTDYPLASIDIGYASPGLWSEHLDLGNTVGSHQQFGYRLNLSHEDGTTYTGAHLQRRAAAFSGSYQVTPDLLLTVDYLTQQRNIQGGVPTFNTSLYPVTSSLPTPRSGDSPFSEFSSAYYKSNIQVATASAQYRLSDRWHVRVDAGRTVKKIDSVYETLYLTSRAGGYSDRLNPFYAPTLTYRNVQAIVEGEVDTGPVTHHLVFGLSQQSLDRRLNTDSALSLYDDSTLGNLYAPPPVPTLSTSVARNNFYTISRFNTRSAFASDTLDFGSHWSVLLGARYLDYEDRTYATSGTLSADYKKQPITPTAAVLFKPSRDTTVYASFVQALEDGGTVGATYANANEALAPIKSRQYEVGFKMDKSRWQLSGAVFEVDRGAGYADYSSNPLGIYSNSGQSRYRGAELSGRFRVIQGLVLGASSTYLNAVYVRAAASVQGHQVESVPRWSSSGYVEWQPQAWRQLSFRAEVTYTGQEQANSANSWTVPDFTLVNLGATYRTALGRHELTLRAGINNLANRRYWYSTASNALMLGAPRLATVNARFDF